MTKEGRLSGLDMSGRMDKAEYKIQVDALERRLGEAQRGARRAEVPVVILFEGWEAAGKGTLINRLALHLDARGFNVHAVRPPTEEERLRPFLWRFWNRLPGKGRILILDRSWCGRVLEDRVEKRVSKATWRRAFGEISAFERQLIDGDYLILKFFCHISRGEQKKRFRKLREDPATRWRVTEEDRRQNRKYDDYSRAYEKMLAATHSPPAPWVVVPTHDRRAALIRIMQTVIDRIGERVSRGRPACSGALRLTGSPAPALDAVDLRLSMDPEEYDRKLDKYQARARELEHRIYKQRIPVVIVYEGWDAAGKGGNIRRLVQRLDPRGYDVIPVGAPNAVEKRHHYLWRFWREFPKAGHIAIFDRSWYGRVLVERVEGFCRPAEWKRAYREINEMEEQWAAFGSVIVKFWIHISPEEQKRRFESRRQTPHKRWKITAEDWRNRKKWNEYKAAVEEMLFRTSTSHAPWTVVEGNSKRFARIKALKTVIAAVEDRL